MLFERISKCNVISRNYGCVQGTLSEERFLLPCVEKYTLFFFLFFFFFLFILHGRGVDIRCVFYTK